MLGSPQVQEKLAQAVCVRNFLFNCFQCPPLEDTFTLLTVPTAKNNTQKKKKKLLGKTAALMEQKSTEEVNLQLGAAGAVPRK